MAKKPSEAFAMSEEDEFIEINSQNEETKETNQGSTEENLENTKETNNDSDGFGGISEDAGDGTGDVSGSESDETKKEETGTEGTGEESADSQGDEKSKTGGEASDGAGGDESGTDEDFFADLSTENDETEGGSQKPAVSFKKLGSAFDIELENDTEEEFTEKVNKKIEEAKMQVDLSKFDPEARRLVKHLSENEGKLGDFFVNPKITELQNVLLMDAEEKVRLVRTQELRSQGTPHDKIEETLDEELNSLSAQKIVDIATKINTDAQKLIATEINEIVGESEKRQEQKLIDQSKKVQKSRENLKNLVQKKDNFLGLKLSDKAKSSIVKDIDTGRFEAIVDLSDEEIQFAAYMIKRQGGKIGETFAKKIGESSREGYNKGIEKITGKLHKTKDEAQGSRTGHQESSEGKKNFESWGTMDL